MKTSSIRKINIVIIVLTILIALVLFIQGKENIRSAGTDNHAENDAVAFYDGAIIKWIIPHRPGGGYDLYARLMAPYLEKYTGARVQLHNIPGAGGLRGVSELFRSPANGLTIALINGSGLVTSKIAEIRGADYEIGELTFLARVVADIRVLTLSGQSNYSSFSDIMSAREEVRIGASGLGGSTYVDAVIIRQVFALKMKVIHGFDNTSAIRQVMLQGKIDGAWSSWGSSLGAVASGQIKLVLQSGWTRAASLPDVPTVFEYVEKTTNPSQMENILTAWDGLNDIGRVIVAPPGIPSFKRAFLREALSQALHDPGFLDGMARADRAIVFASGEESELMVKRALRMSTETKSFFTRAVHSGLR